LDAKAYPAWALAELYFKRWRMEISQPYYDSSKHLYLVAA
jgi:hypothetical protein